MEVAGVCALFRVTSTETQAWTDTLLFSIGRNEAQRGQSTRSGPGLCDAQERMELQCGRDHRPPKGTTHQADNHTCARSRARHLTALRVVTPSFLPCCSPARTARARTVQHETLHLRCSRFVFKWFPQSHSAALLPLLPRSLARRVAFVTSSALTVTTLSSSQLIGRSGVTRGAC